jgi:hypothetical protein
VRDVPGVLGASGRGEGGGVRERKPAVPPPLGEGCCLPVDI